MNQIAIGIVGAGGRGHSFFGLFTNNLNVRLEALCDIDKEALDEAAKTAGVSKTYTDYEEMLDKANLDAVIVGTPMHLHASQSIRALERGIHVLSEVPAAVSIDEAKDLVRVCKKSSAKYMMAENCCYMTPNVLVLEIARAGLFGTMYFGEGQYIHELKELNETTRWRRKWQTGINGCTYPTHSLGPVCQWMNDRVVSVSCTGTGHHYTDPRGDDYENEDSTITSCRMEGGGLAVIRLDMLSERPHNMTYYSLQGTEGCYEAARGLGDEPKIWLKSRHNELEWTPLSQLEDEFLPQEWKSASKEAQESGHGGSDYMVIQDFVRTIVEDGTPSIGIHEAMDMTLPGLISQQSIEQASIWLPVPDSRMW